MVDGDRPKWRAIDRNEQRIAEPSRDLLSFSQAERLFRHGAYLEDEFRRSARSPRRSDGGPRSNRRPIELIRLAGPPAIPDFGSLAAEQ